MVRYDGLQVVTCFVLCSGTVKNVSVWCYYMMSPLLSLLHIKVSLRRTGEGPCKNDRRAIGRETHVCMDMFVCLQRS